MPSGPTLFDDEGDPHPTASSGRPGRSRMESDLQAALDADDARTDDARIREGHTADETSSPPPSRHPNYLVRRAIVIVLAVAVVAVGAVVAVRMFRSDSGSAVTGAVAPDWNRVVLVDQRTGRVVVDDPAGREMSRVESGIRTPTASRVIGSTLLVTSGEATAVVDIDSGVVTSVDLAADAIVEPSGSALTMIASTPAGDRAVLVHGPTGDTIDTDELAPVVGARYDVTTSRTSPSGRDVLVTDTGNFQSVLFSFDRDEPAYFPGLALAVSDEIVVTAQNVGTDATVNVFDLTGAPVTTGRAPSVRAAMVVDGGVLLATVDGDLVTLDASSGDIGSTTSVRIGTIGSGHVTPSGDRLVLTGSTGTAIVGSNAKVIATYPGFQLVADDGGPVPAPRGSTCVTLADSGTNTADATISVVDVTDGSVVVEATSSGAMSASADGCSVATTTAAGFDIVSRDAVRSSRTDDIPIALSPDAASLVVERRGRLQLIPVGDLGDVATTNDGSGIDLGPRGRTVWFARS